MPLKLIGGLQSFCFINERLWCLRRTHRSAALLSSIFESPPREISVHSAFNQCTALLIFSEMWTENKPEKAGRLSFVPHCAEVADVFTLLLLFYSTSWSLSTLGPFLLTNIFFFFDSVRLFLGLLQRWPLFCLSALLLFRFPGRGHCAHAAGASSFMCCRIFIVLAELPLSAENCLFFHKVVDRRNE